MGNAVKKLKGFLERHERHISTAAFVAGFVWDQLTLTRIDQRLDQGILLSYILVAAAGIWISCLRDAGRLRGSRGGAIAEYAPVAMQFVFGGLFSGFFVFYSRSASLAASWPFLLFLLGLLVGNEFFRERYARFAFRAGIFFITLYSYAILVTPVVLGRMGGDVFLVSGFASLAAMGAFLLACLYAAPAKFKEHRRALAVIVLCVFSAFNFLYATNILPPIPLSLKEVLVAHSVSRTGTEYRVAYERLPGIVLAGGGYERAFHRAGSEPVYVYTAVFAPTRITAALSHRWSFYNEKLGAWTATDRIGFDIVGGRSGGWRGYTFKRNIFPAKWRVDVLTDRDQLLGRVSFTVVRAQAIPALVTEMR